MTNGRTTRPPIRIPVTPHLGAALAAYRQALLCRKGPAATREGKGDGRQAAAAPREEAKKPGKGKPK